MKTAEPSGRSGWWMLWVAAAACAALWGQPASAPAQPDAPATDTAGDTPPDTPPADPGEPTGASAPTAPSPAASVMPAGAQVAVIPIRGLIYDFTLESLQRRVDRALDAGASVIVLELDTPGGVVTSALKISKYIKTLPVPTVAWVNNEAYSAGILIGSACDRLIMAPASATGDCAPIVPGTDLAPTERAKALSPILEEFRDNARDNGYDYVLFHAMAVLGVEVYQVEHKETGQRRLVNQVDYRVMVQGVDPDAAAAASGGGGIGRFLGLGSGGGSGGGAAGGVSAEEVGAAALDVATDQDVGRWTLVDQVHDGRTLLTLNQTRAQEVGLSQATIGSQAELKQHLGAASVTPVPQSWSEDLAGFLTSPAVRAVLVLGLLLGGYIEFQTPGLGVPGAVAAICLITLLGAPFVVGLAEVWHIIVFFLGFILLVVELMFTPTFGLLGIAGLVMMFLGLALSVVPTGSGGGISMPPPEMWNRLLYSTTSMMVGLIGGSIGLYALTKYFGQIPVLNRLILQDDAALSRGAGPGAGPGAVVVGGGAEGPDAGPEGDAAGGVRVGDKGVAITELRPSGRAEFAGRIIDVVTVGSFIDAGQDVVIVSHESNRVAVDLAE